LYNFIEIARERFNKFASVTGRQMRPPLLLRREDAAFCEESTEGPLPILKLSKPFPGSWMIESGG
jgi:hypothetical protein